MTDLGTISETSLHPIGPGRLILIVGPSGAGKDTLMGLAQTACDNDPTVVFARRVVTREASIFENNDVVSSIVFGQMLARGDLAFQWHAHGLSYGLPRSIIDQIRSGWSVVANVSRTVLDVARRSYANVTVVLVTAPPAVLAERLASRGRASDGPLEDRLRRIVTAEPDVVINNVGRPEDHARELLDIIRGKPLAYSAQCRES